MSVNVAARSQVQSGTPWWTKVRAVLRRGLRNLDAQCDAYQSVMFPEASRSSGVRRK